MKTMWINLAVCCLTVLATSRSTALGQNQTEQRIRPTGPSPGDVAHRTRDGNRDRQANPSSAMIRRRVTDLNRLHAAIKKQLDLSREQEEAVGALFKNYVRSLKSLQGKRRTQPFEPAVAQKLRELRTQMKNARSAGDDVEVQRLRTEFQRVRRPRPAATLQTVDQFIGQVIQHVDEKDHAAFQALVRRSRILVYRPSGAGKLRLLLRAAMHPSIGLSDEQKRAVRDIMRESLLSVGRAHEQSGDGPAVIEHARADVFALLTPEQRTKVEALLAQRDGNARSDTRYERARTRDAHERSLRDETSPQPVDRERAEPEIPDRERAEPQKPRPPAEKPQPEPERHEPPEDDAPEGDDDGG